MYYVGKNGQQSGPYTLEQLHAMVSSGQLAPTDLVWTEGMTAWQPAGTVAAIFPNPTPGMPPTPAMPAPIAPAPLMAAPGAKIPTYLWQAIATTLCCCLPFGIVAIVYAAQVNGKLESGDVMGAQESSKKAKMWCWIAFGVGIPANVIPLIFGIFQAVSQMNRF